MSTFNALLTELSPYLLTGIFALVGWYLRDSAKRHEALVRAVEAIPGTITGLEAKLEEKIDTHARRFDRFVLSQEARLTAMETRCAVEHGELPDRRRNLDHKSVVDWQVDSNIGHGVKKT